MYSYDEIMRRLRNGEDSEKIAREMADALNKASKDYEAEHSRGQKQKAFKKECANAANAMNKAILAYASLEDVDMDEYLWNADTCAKTIGAYKSLGAMLNNLLDADELQELQDAFRSNKGRKKDNHITINKSGDSFDSIIGDFLNSIGC